MIFVLCGVLVTLVIIFLRYIRKTNSTNIPGPIGLPVLGNILSLGKSPHIQFCKWGNKFGPVYRVQIGELSFVVLNNAKVIRGAFSDARFCGRLDNDAFNILTRGKNGVINSEPPIWQEQRKFMLRTLRNVGFDNTNKMEKLITKDVDEFLNWINVNQGVPINIKRVLTISIFNSIWKVVASQKFCLNDPEISLIMDKFDIATSNSMKTGFALFFPKLSKLFSLFSGWEMLVEGTNPLMNFFIKTINEHEKEFKEASVKDFIDAYITKMKETTDSNSSFYHHQGKPFSSHKHLLGTVSNLFSATTDTTSITILWALLYIVACPKIIERLLNEINLVIGTRCPKFADRPLMPYTEAIILETMRMSSIAPIGLFHSTLEDLEFQGFHIPKQTVIIGNFYSVHHDQSIWTDPETFLPERFLSPDEKTLTNHDSFIPFSTGRRQCPGEAFARNQIFIYLTSLFQRFIVTHDPSDANWNLEPEFSFVLNPKPVKLLFHSRKLSSTTCLANNNIS